MPVYLFRRFALLLAAAPVLAQVPTAEHLLAKARAALEENGKREKHWNWTSTESTVVQNSSHAEVKRLPKVTVESVIRKDGSRCTAVLSWGDGTEPYKLSEDADARCAGQDPVAAPLSVDALLSSAKAKIIELSDTYYQVVVLHDRGRVHDPRPDVRCTASVEAIVKIDRATWFPVHLEGTVMDSGCESETTAEIHYGEQQLSERSKRALFKGTTFQMDFTLQQDKYGNPANSYWICAAQHWSAPVSKAGAVVSHNRRIPLNPVLRSGFLVKDIQTAAQEFGVQSSTRFDSIPK